MGKSALEFEKEKRITFLRQFLHLFERSPDWLVVIPSAANVMVRTKAGQAKTLKSGWQAIRRTNNREVSDCTAPSLFMEKEEITGV